VYRFEALFANVAAGWEKGSVENLVGYARRNYFVPLPEGANLEAINAELRQNALLDQQRTMAGRTDPIASRLTFERGYLGPLPAHVPDYVEYPKGPKSGFVHPPLRTGSQVHAQQCHVLSRIQCGTGPARALLPRPPGRA